MTEAEYYKQQDEQAEKEEFIAKRVNEMWKDLHSGDLDIELIIELREIFFDNNGESDYLFKAMLIGDQYGATKLIDCFSDCEHVNEHMNERAEHDLTQEAEDNYNERACEARDCD